MSNKYLEKIASSDISRDALFKGVKHLNTDYYDGQRAGVGDSARAAGWSALYGAGLGGGATAAMGSVIPASHLIMGNNTLAKLSLGRLGKHSLIGAGIGAAGLGATSLLRRYGSMKRTEAFDNKANALGISPEDRKHYVEEYNAFDDDLPASERAQQVHALMHNKQASDYEYSGPSNWQTAGIVGAGMLGSAALGVRAIRNLDKVLKPHGLKATNMAELKAAYYKQQLHPEVMDALTRMDKATSSIGMPAAAGLAAIPAVALHRQYQDYRSGNKDPHYGRGALLGTIAGTAALGTPLGLVGGAAAGLGAVGLNHAHNKYMNKIASKQSDLEANEAFQKMKAQRDSAAAAKTAVTPSAGGEFTPKGVNIKADYHAIIQQQNQDRVQKELARQQQAKIDNRPFNRPNNVALRMRRDAEHEIRMTQPREVPAARPPAADDRNLTTVRERMKEQRLARKAQAAQPTAPAPVATPTVSHNYSNTTHTLGPTHGLPTNGYTQAPGAGTSATPRMAAQPVATPHVAPAPAAAAAEDTATRTAKMLAKYKKPALALGALGLAGYALSGRNTDTELHNQ